MGENGNGNDDDRGSKDNTGHEHKPDHAKANENAPTGSLGTNRISTPSLGLGGSSQQNRTAQQAKQTQQSPDQKTQQAEDNRPIAIKTNDEEVNAQSEADGQQLMTQEEINAKGNPQEQPGDRPQFSQSDYAKAFRQARGQERQRQQQQSKGIGLE